MDVERVLIELLQRNNASVSNAAYSVKCELKEINRTLQFIGIRLEELNKHMAENKQNNET